MSNMNHIYPRIKEKKEKEINLGKRLQNIGNTSITMIRTDMGLDKSAKKKQCNESIDSSISDDKNNNTLNETKNNIIVNNLSAQKIKINNSFSGHKNNSNSNATKLVYTYELCEKEEPIKRSYEFIDLRKEK